MAVEKVDSTSSLNGVLESNESLNLFAKTPPSFDVNYISSTSRDSILTTYVPPSLDAREKEELQNAAHDLLSEFLRIGEDKKYQDHFNFEAWSNAFYKVLFAALDNDQEHFHELVDNLQVESRKMSQEREREYAKVLQNMERNKWFDFLGLAGTALSGAATTIAIGTGWGAVVVGVATLAIVALSLAEKSGTLESVAAIGSDGNQETVNSRLNYLKIGTAIAIAGASLLSFASAAMTVTAGAWNLLTIFTSMFSGATQIASTASRTQAAFDEKELKRLTEEIQHNFDKRDELSQSLETVIGYIQQYRRMRKEMQDSRHQVMIQLVR